jgi:hypothetical protein
MVVHWPSPRLPDNQSAFIRLNRDFYQNSGDVVQSDVPLVLMPVIGCWAIRKRLTILSGLPHLSLIHGGPIALGATARPTKPASSSAVAGGRETVVEPLFGNRAARVKDSTLELAPRMVVWQGPLFCPRSARAAAASWSQARARRINLRGCVVADRARSFGHHGGGRALESCGSSTAVLNASAVTAPTPGTVIRRRHTWSCLATASTAVCSNASWLMTAARVCDHASSPPRVLNSLSGAG